MSNAMQRKSWNWFRNEGENARRFSQRALTPWRDSVDSFAQMQRNVEQLFDNSLRTFGWPSFGFLPGLLNAQNLNALMFQPHVNIASNEDEYTITVEVPGMAENDIKLDVSRDGQLTISGEKRLSVGGEGREGREGQEGRPQRQERNKDYECVECEYGAFQRTLSLPEDVDVDGIEADFQNGVLIINCPRAQRRSQARPIRIGERSRQDRGGPERGHQDRGPHGGSQDNARPGEARPGAPGPKKAA